MHRSRVSGNDSGRIGQVQPLTAGRYEDLEANIEIKGFENSPIKGQQVRGTRAERDSRGIGIQACGALLGVVWVANNQTSSAGDDLASRVRNRDSPRFRQ